AVASVQTGADRIIEVTARLQLANVLEAEGQDNPAAIEMQRAAAVLNTPNPGAVATRYILTARIGLAALQLRRGDATSAIQTLDTASDLANKTQGYFISLNFYRTRGDVNLALHRP